MSLNENQIERTAYTFWNVISDMGGLFGVLASFCVSIVSVFSYQKSVNYLASQLYSKSEPKVLDTLALEERNTRLSP